MMASLLSLSIWELLRRKRLEKVRLKLLVEPRVVRRESVGVAGGSTSAGLAVVVEVEVTAVVKAAPLK